MEEIEKTAMEMQAVHINPAFQCEYQDYSADTAIKTLEWLTCPVTTVEEDAVLPPISVFSQPEITDEVELVVHSNGEGTAQVAGQRRVSLRSQGSHKPSVGTFEDIRIKRAGLYVIEVRSVRNPEISLVADHPTDVGTLVTCALMFLPRGHRPRMPPVCRSQR